MTVRFHDRTRESQLCPFFKAGREQLCTAVSGGMRCSLHEIEHFCTNEEHRVLKALAAVSGVSMRDLVLATLRREGLLSRPNEGARPG